MAAAFLFSFVVLFAVLAFMATLALTSGRRGAPRWPRSANHDRLVYHWDTGGREERYV